MKTLIKNLPQEMKDAPRWVCSDVQGPDEQGKYSKVPKNPHTGGNASSTNSETWGTFDEAVQACADYGFEYLAFAFGDGFACVDLDHCIDDTDLVEEFVESLQSYCELSVSGTGLHIICFADELPPQANKKKEPVEMYTGARFMVCTGNIYTDQYKQVRDCRTEYRVLHAKHLGMKPEIEPASISTTVTLEDEEVLEKASTCKSGEVFQLLYDGDWEEACELLYPDEQKSQSEADLVLCCHLAFWTGRNAEQMDRLFRNSGLMRKKWDRMTGEDTYGNLTIKKAISICKQVYKPQNDDTALAVQFFKEAEYDNTETGNAKRLFDKFGHILHYSYNRKKWYYWNGQVWKMDEGYVIKQFSDEVCADLKTEALAEQDPKLQAKKVKFFEKSSSHNSKEALVKECQHIPGIPVAADAFDKNRFLLNCQNGIVDLKTGKLLPHNPFHLQSKICCCEYDDSGKKPELWMKFLNDFTQGDEELMEYIQRSIGYSLTGETTEQCVFFLHGQGRNGKSTFLDSLSDMLGDYAQTVRPESLMMKQLGGTGANNDIAALQSVRFAKSEETTEGVRLNEGLIKQLTGGSKVKCRFLYSEEFEYEPEFSVWMATNHKPVIRGTDLGIWRRIKLIPFEVTIPEEQVDKNLKYKLRQEFPQILAWAVEGCIKWQQDGLHEPDCVKNATEGYKQEMDLLASFMDQCIEIDYSSPERVQSSDLFALYSKWARQNNEYEMKSQKFYRDIKKKLPESERSGKGVFYPYIRFTDYAKELTGQMIRFSNF